MASGFGQGLVVAMAVPATALYLHGTVRLWRRHGIGRGVRLWQAGCFAAGIAALLLAWAGPFAEPSIRMLCADTARHMILFCLAPPLLVLGAPQAPMFRGLPSQWSRRAMNWSGRMVGARGGLLSLPMAALLQAAILGLTHARPVLEASTSSIAAAWAIDLVLLLAGLAFWATALPQRYSLSHPNGAAAFWMLASCGALWFVGGIMTRSPGLLYPAYDQGVTDEVWSALVDQQIAGLVAWVAGLVFLLGAVAMLARWRRAIRQREQSTCILADSLPLSPGELRGQGGGSASALMGPRAGGAVLGGGS